MRPQPGLFWTATLLRRVAELLPHKISATGINKHPIELDLLTRLKKLRNLNVDSILTPDS
ncbi:MAG: hypothetical protein DRP71_14500 [Verrucomicrobia bacterium]|nr:MAG: hypothetical protein DRP71_14500 [Verrucomicrobiota bacterium]